MTFHPFDPMTVCKVCLQNEGHADHTPPIKVPSAGRPRSYWVHWNTVYVNHETGQAVVRREAARRAFFLVNQWDSWMVPIAKAVNPEIKILVYKDASSTRPMNNGVANQGSTGVWYNSAPDEWFAKDSEGRRIEYSGYPGHWLMDVGNRGYQEEWAKNVSRAVQVGGFDGVLIDNLLWAGNQYGRTPRGWETEEQTQVAYESFLLRTDQVDMGLRFGNLSNARLKFGRWSRYLPYLDGAWDEWWLAMSDTDLLPDYPEGWARQVNEIALCESAGKTALVQPHLSTPGNQAWRYTFASYLIGSGGRSAYTPIRQTDGYGLPSAWTEAYDWDLGPAIGKINVLASGLRIRVFERGAVVVNPTTRVITLTEDGLLDGLIGETGERYNASASELVIGPKDGRVFRRAV